MPRPCSLCQSPQRTEIDAALASGVSYRNIAEQFRISLSAISRHKSHIRQVLQQAEREKGKQAVAVTVAVFQERSETLWESVSRLLKRAESQKDVKAEIAAIREARELIRSGYELFVGSDLSKRLEALEAAARDEAE